MGMVNLKFEYGTNVYLEDKAREFCGAIVSYYGYLHNEFLPNLPHESIIEALSVWIILQGLADYICNLGYIYFYS